MTKSALTDKQRVLALELKVANLEKLGELLMTHIASLNADKRMRDIRAASMDRLTGD